MTQFSEKKTSLLVEDLDALLLSIPHEDAISDAFFLTEGGIAPLKERFFKARLARLEAAPFVDDILPTLNFLIEKADKKDKAVSYKEEGFQRRPGEKVTGTKGSAGEGKTLATGQWMTAEGKFADWSSVGKVQAAKKGFTSGFSRQMKLEIKASKKPESKLHKEDPRKYWKERGKLASSYAQTMEGVNNGSIKGKEADRLMGVDKNGKNVSGLNPSQQKRRSELLGKAPEDMIKKDEVKEQAELRNEDGSLKQEARAAEAGINEASELRKLNSGLSLRERAEAIGTDLDMVEYHVNQIKDSGSAVKRALDPALRKVAPPVGDWPDSLGGADVADRTTKNFEKVTKGLPRSQAGSLRRQYEAADRGEAKGEADYKAGLGKDEQQRTQQAPTAHEYKDRVYRATWTSGKAPQGVRVYTSSRGKQYYLASENKVILEERAKAREEKQKSAASEAKAKADKKAAKPKKKEKEEKEEAKVPVPAGGPEETPDDPDSGAGAGAGAGAEVPSPPPKEPTPKQPKAKAPKKKAATPEVSVTSDEKAWKAKAATEAKKKSGAEKKPKEKKEVEGGILGAIKQGWKEGRAEGKKIVDKKAVDKKKDIDKKKKSASYKKGTATIKARAKAEEEAKKKRSTSAKKGVKTKRKKKQSQEKEQRRMSGQDLPGRIDSWLKKHPKVENLIRSSADDPENIVWLRLSDDLMAMSEDTAYDFLDRLDKGGEVFFKGYIQSFKEELRVEQEAVELLRLVNSLSSIEK